MGWIGEAVLWCENWAHHGGFLGRSSCNLICLSAETFRKIAKQYRTAMFLPAQYACAYVEALNELPPGACSELDDDEAIQAETLVKQIRLEESEAAGKSERRNSGGRLMQMLHRANTTSVRQ